MKLFISADIEGCAGVALTDETHKKESVYQRFAEEMTEEVVAACEAAHEAGADEIVVKDGHGDASNIDPLKMPEYVTLIRGKSGHPYNMMYGIDDSYDGVLYLGYHAPAGDPKADREDRRARHDGRPAAPLLQERPRQDGHRPGPGQEGVRPPRDDQAARDRARDPRGCEGASAITAPA